MDNQFENDFYGAEPQKPITEKPENAAQPPEQPEAQVFSQQPQAQSGAYDFQPQKPLMQQNEPARRADEQGFNPIQHQAVYSDNRFVGMPQGRPPFRAQPGEPRQASVQGYYQAPQPYGGQPVPQYPAQNPQGYPQRGDVTTETDEKPKKNKVNTALVVIIIVLGALLAASVFGMFGYTVYQSAQNRKDGSRQSSAVQDEPQMTLPNERGFHIPETPAETTPAQEHKESDFSDKTDKNYSGLAIAEKPSDAQTNTKYNAEYAFNTASDSVVSVLCYSGEVGDNKKTDSQGSGIVISADGYVVTNAHVIGNSKTAYAVKVVTADGKEYQAGIVGFDARTDIAVLKLVDAKGLKAAQFGNSDKLQLGEDIIVIGSPGGIEYQNSMTKGIVSALNREASNKSLSKYIQTDAAINPGNSGGPAVNICGQVVGIASAKIADEKYEGMGFCIPSVQVKQIVDSLIQNGYVAGRVKIGISGNAVSAAEAEMYQCPQGIIVYSIEEDGPCDGTDLAEGDIITAVDGKEITSFAEIYQLLESHKDGDKVKVKAYNVDEQTEYEFEITLKADK